MVFWWTGRGFLTLLFLVGSMGLFGLVVTLAAGDRAFEAQPWLWGVSVLLASGVNWFGGRRLNAKARKRPQPKGLLGRVIYPARNRFMSLPMESWSILGALVGALMVLRGVVAVIAHRGA